jgi:hypothetical protein
MFTKEQLEEIIAGIFAEQYKALLPRLEEMVNRAVAARPFPLYKGVWDDETLFVEHDMVTQAGALWCAQAASKGVKPGTDEGAKVWKLAVKSAKPAKLPALELSDEGELSFVCEGAEPVVIGSIKGLITTLLRKHGAIEEVA